MKFTCNRLSNQIEHNFTSIVYDNRRGHTIFIIESSKVATVSPTKCSLFAFSIFSFSYADPPKCPSDQYFEHHPKGHNKQCSDANPHSEKYLTPRFHRNDLITAYI